MKNYYHSLFSEISQRSVDATLSVLGIRNPQLRKHIKDQLTDELSQGNRILADPVFEAAFPWAEVEETFEDLANSDFLHPSFVEALDAIHSVVNYHDARDPKDLSEQSLKRTWRPRTHQLRSWEVLKEDAPKSLIVTSGTGSGKTECFMVPILDDLVRQQESTNQKLEGVQALFIYPLNALINSQRERILSWTLNFGDKVRFCLYNGNTPKVAKTAAFINNSPRNEVYDRPHLWQSPPPILITNPTMLEYMMIRSQDRPILQASQGKLKYIVLDEAHTYIGSQAAELALLIRRVLNGFGVEAENVRFIATSATIGSDVESEIALKKYLADIAGINENSIEVVGGSRTIPVLDLIESNTLSYKELNDLEISRNIESFYQNETLARLRANFISPDGQQAKAKKLTQITDLLFPGQSSNIEKQKEALKWIDLASNDVLKKGEFHYLPLRGHFFHKVLSGLWSCVDTNCKCKLDTHLNENWDFGKVYTQQRLTCECGAPVFELVFCSECNEPHLRGEIVHENEMRRITQNRSNNLDEFELNQEQPDDDEDGQGSAFESDQVLIYPRAVEESISSRINIDGRLGDDSNTYKIRVNYNNQNESCSNCGFIGSLKQKSMRGAYLGMPFYISNIIPSLLDHIKDGNNPMNQPYRGRRLLTFTDSRQGTAKIAIKIQQESERINIRALILKALLSSGNQDIIQNLSVQIEALESNPNNPPAIKNLIDQLRNQRSQLLLSSKSYSQILSFLQQEPDVYHHTKDSYEILDLRFRDNLSKLSYLLLLREFNRRPKRVNSLETFGLVATSYPQLNLINNVPNEFTERGLTINDWMDFLKVAIDYFIRDRVFISIEDNDDFIKWLGAKISPKFLLPPDSLEDQTSVYRKWPTFDNLRGIRQNRLVRILSQGLAIDLQIITPYQKDIINSILEKSWSALRSIEILKPIGGGFKMKFSDLSISLVKSAFICPITQKFLDTTFRGYTPYLPIGANPGEYSCEKIDMPSFPRIMANDSMEYKLQMRSWINNDPTILELKRRGLWSEPANKILEGTNFIRAVEHSAQIRPQSRLEKYENKFKKGYINVLNCSTTMEMGVDIGGLSIVCNNNVPPHPSNYLQRAGRAGRRGESRALSMTLCKNNPHDQQVFQNPLWAFEALMKKPKITLSSDRIVRRHLQAYLFGWFLNHNLADLDGVTITLRSDWFYEGEPSINDRFIFWLESLLISCPTILQNGLDYIKRKSVLEGIALHDIINPSKELLEKLQYKWREQLNYYLGEIETIPNLNNPASPQYLQRVQADLANHRKIYLLSVLITGGFLPGYGFPTNISTFNNYTISDFLQNNQKQNEEREDNINLIAGKPTRNMAIALTEYAPGSQVVLDGKVFTSRGITLNFQNPDDSVKSHQVIHTAWRCYSCGKTGVSHFERINSCTNPTCTNPHQIEFFEYLEPAGFATSFYESPTNDISTQKFVAAQVPWVNTHTELKQLINPAIGSCFSDEEGEIFYHNKGENGNGFALCFKCGYTDSLTSDRAIPTGFNDHNKLRGKNTAAGNSARCEPENNHIRRDISLGFVDKTDVFELYLKHQETGEYFLVSNEDNKKLSWTLGVAFRHGLAKTLGINAEELGVIVKQVVNHNLSNSAVYAICLYDSNSGGSGFASLAGQPEIFKSMLKYGRELLDCANCQNACQNCLLQFDTKQYVEFLDRRIGAGYLTNDLINSLGLPEDEKILGINSQFCQFDFFKEVKLGTQGKGEKIQIFLKGDIQDWEIAESSIRKHLTELVGQYGKFEKLEMWMKSDSFDQLSSDQKLDFYYLLAAEPNITLNLSDNLEILQVGEVLARTWNNDVAITYASKEAAAVLFNGSWGDTQGSMQVKSHGLVFNLHGIEVNRNSLIPARGGNNIHIRLIQELNSTIECFGLSFWGLVEEQLNQNGFANEFFGRLKLVDYSDRYLQSPFTTILLTRIISTIPFEKSTDLEIVISTLQSKNGYAHYQRNIINNWFLEEDESRTDLIKELLADFENVEVNLGVNNRELPHSREMNLEFENGRILNIRLDQGLGYWNSLSRTMYPFNESAPDQVKWIKGKLNELRTANSSRHPTYIDLLIE
ncbi:DEAD/DEAH box helicase [Algoriphagus persicinus]|uniref:DEAD/DEAH box helicase n=1 Tax=Algoriphagus persicinus TaxID=3108754 RepID=UPI002B38AD50|nr:DEAD/DEAH box helicase [Algoriphagus sp. E1-3-M2]MEB2786515.1 DEAD/DEAH box helicase [Algoriphagus sp. E1-3-M2]